MASGIIEKSNSGLFCNEIEMNGKYATMVRFLKEEICDGAVCTPEELESAAAVDRYQEFIRRFPERTLVSIFISRFPIRLTPPSSALWSVSLSSILRKLTGLTAVMAVVIL